MVYGPSFLYLVVSTVMPASRVRFCEYCELAAAVVGAGAAAAVAGLPAGAVVGAAAGAVVGLAAGAVVGAAAGGDAHALTNTAAAVTRPTYERSFIQIAPLLLNKVRAQGSRKCL